MRKFLIDSHWTGNLWLLSMTLDRVSNLNRYWHIATLIKCLTHRVHRTDLCYERKPREEYISFSFIANERSHSHKKLIATTSQEFFILSLSVARCGWLLILAPCAFRSSFSRRIIFKLTSLVVEKWKIKTKWKISWKLPPFYYLSLEFLDYHMAKVVSLRLTKK